MVLFMDRFLWMADQMTHNTGKERFIKIIVRGLAICLILFSFFFSYTWPDGYCIGDSFLNVLGLKPWSNGVHGTHYTVVYSLCMLLVAFLAYAQTTKKRLMTFFGLICGFTILFFAANIAF